MIEIYYNYASDIGPGWVSGSSRFANAEEVLAWLKKHLDEAKEVLITAYVEH